MTLNRIYVIPHGDELIDLPNENSKILSEHIREVAKNDNSDVLLIISPHGVTLGKNMAVINTENFYALTKLKDLTLTFKAKNERNLTEQIVRDVPDLCEELRFSTYAGELSDFPLDFGSSIPLYFFNQRQIVVMGQPRIKDRERLVKFGSQLYSIIQKYPKSVTVILSADQAHTHSPEGIYGYSPKAEEYEKILIRCLRTNDFQDLLNIDEKIITDGKPDSFWNMLILYGMLTASGRKMSVVYNYVQVYFGMLLAVSD